jgi:hypothetical protein
MADSESPFAVLEKLAQDDAGNARPRTAARRGTRASGTDSGSRATPTSRTPLEKRLSRFFTMVALVTSAALDKECGMTVQNNAEDLARVWGELAQQDPRVKKVIEALLSSGAYAQALTVTGMTVVPILRHHEIIRGRAADVMAASFTDIPEGENDDSDAPSTVPA